MPVVEYSFYEKPHKTSVIFHFVLLLFNISFLI